MQENANDSPAPPSERIPSLDTSDNPDEQHMFRLCCGEPGCATAVWLRPDQLGLEAVNLQTVDLQAVNLQSVDLQQVSAGAMILCSCVQADSPRLQLEYLTE